LTGCWQPAADKQKRDPGKLGNFRIDLRVTMVADLRAADMMGRKLEHIGPMLRRNSREQNFCHRGHKT